MRRAHDDAAHPFPAHSDTTADEIEVEVAALDGGPARQRSQTRPRRVWRAVVVTCAVVAVVCLALNGPAALLAGAQQVWGQLQAQVAPAPRVNALPDHLSASAWTAIRLPPEASYVRDVTFSPAASTPLDAYACWLVRPASAHDTPVLSLYATRDGAHAWSRLASPVGHATSCRFVVDVTEPRYALLVTDASVAGPCAAPRIFATDAWGATWRTVSLPAPLATACMPGYFLANGLLYAWSRDGQFASSAPPGSPLLVSADSGATWTSAFAAMPPASLPTILAAHTDGSLLAVISAQESADVGPPVPATLWCRAGPSGRWSLLASAPEESGAIAVASDAATGTGCAWGPIYAFSARLNLNTGQPSVVSVAALHGASWSGLPTLPIAGATGRQPLGESGRVLGVGPAGTLLVDVPDTSLNLGDANPPHSIWGWDPTSGHWLRDYHSEPGNAEIDGFSWDHTAHGTPTADLWLFSLNWGMPAFTGVFHSSFAATPLAPAGTDDG